MIKIGTRESPLAMAQAVMVQKALAAALGQDLDRFPLVPMTSTGDQITDRALAEAGGKGLFAKELERALFGGSIDIAVHSAKDLETVLPDGLKLFGVLEREDPRDALVSRGGTVFTELPQGAKVGTASRRREACLRALRPDLQISLIRGNIQTRLRRLADGEFDATLLAVAGLIRGGLADKAAEILPMEMFLPAAGQGIIAIEGRAENEQISDLITKINHGPSWTALLAERAFLAAIDGSCHTPVAAHATLKQGQLDLSVRLMADDGTFSYAHHARGDAREAEAIGARLGAEALRALTPEEIAVLGLARR